MSETTAEIIERVGLVPVLRAKSIAQAHAVVEAMIAGGVTVVEVTMTVPNAVHLLKELKKEHGAKILLGLRHGNHGERSRRHDQRGRRIRRQPEPASRSHRRHQGRGQTVHSRRADADRSDYRASRRR